MADNFDKRGCDKCVDVEHGSIVDPIIFKSGVFDTTYDDASSIGLDDIDDDLVEDNTVVSEYINDLILTMLSVDKLPVESTVNYLTICDDIIFKDCCIKNTKNITLKIPVKFSYDCNTHTLIGTKKSDKLTTIEKGLLEIGHEDVNISEPPYSMQHYIISAFILIESVTGELVEVTNVTIRGNYLYISISPSVLHSDTDENGNCIYKLKFHRFVLPYVRKTFSCNNLSCFSIEIDY